MDCDGSGMPAWNGRARLAVLIDGENVSPRHARAVFEAAAKLGEATVRRIYGDFSNGRLASWEGGFPVYGFGERKTPQAFRNACHRFVTLGKAPNGAIGQSENWN